MISVLSDIIAKNSTDEILAKTRDLNAFQRPSKRDYKNFRTWFWIVKPLSYELEEQFIKRKEDLVSLRHGREWSGFDGFIETCLQKVHCRLTQVLATQHAVKGITHTQHRRSSRPKSSAKRPTINAFATTRSRASKSW